MGRNNHRKQQQPQNIGKKRFNFMQNAEQFTQIEARFMATIVALCAERTPFDNVDNLLQQLDLLHIRNSQEEQHRIAAQLWSAYEELVKVLPSGILLDMDEFLPAFSKSIITKTTENSLAKNALSVCAYLAECIGFSFAAICPQLNQIIINIDAQNVPEGIRWNTLKRINDRLSVSSLIHEHFPQFAISLIGCLHKEDMEEIQNNLDLFELVTSILRTSTALIKPHALLVELQQHVCLAALSLNPDIGVFKLLNSLLENNHEAIPLPIQAARTIFWRDYSRQDPEFQQEVMKGRNLCQIIVRPRRIPCCSDVKTTTPSTSASDSNSKAAYSEQVNVSANESDMDLRTTIKGAVQYGNKPTASKSNSQTNIRRKGTFLNYVERRKLITSQPTEKDENDSSDSSTINLEDEEDAESDQEQQVGTSSSSMPNNTDENVSGQQQKYIEARANAGNDFADMTTDEMFKDFIID